MTRRTQPSRMLALLAAYVVALQALLLPLSVAAGAATGFSLCASASSATGGTPAGHPEGCPCAAGCGMQCCQQGAVALPPQIGFAFAATRRVAMAPALYFEPADRPAAKGPQIPRAPPGI